MTLFTVLLPPVVGDRSDGALSCNAALRELDDRSSCTVQGSLCTLFENSTEQLGRQQLADEAVIAKCTAKQEARVGGGCFKDRAERPQVGFWASAKAQDQIMILGFVLPGILSEGEGPDLCSLSWLLAHFPDLHLQETEVLGHTSTLPSVL